MTARENSFGTLRAENGMRFVDMRAAADRIHGLGRLPVSLRLVLENLLRNEDGKSVTADDISALASRKPGGNELEIAFHPSRVLMQDYSGMPALIDLATMRDRAALDGLPPETVNPRVRTDVVVDHSIIVHEARARHALATNQKKEIEDNAERFAFLKWAQQAFENLRIVPPGQGIIHQINLEYLAEVVAVVTAKDGNWIVPDTLIGTDSHTPMINGLGVLGWGVGGIEAEAVMMGEAVSMLVPPVIGVRLSGSVRDGVLATDVVLSLTETLRKRRVVGTFLEFFGPGMSALPIADRATIANMTPEFGATISLFPSDARAMRYLKLTGRPASLCQRAEDYLRRNGFWFDPDAMPDFDDVIDFDLSSVGRVAAGPSRPEQKLALAELPNLIVPRASGTPLPAESPVRNGDVVIAAITSCTNTSNPAAMLAAGLLARKARQRGMGVPLHVKTSLAPGSRVVADYLSKAGLLDDLAALGFDVVGFGCTTCVGNSGALAGSIVEAIDAYDLNVAAVLSGNRNFEARVHTKVKSNFLVSPPLVVAYALAGTVLRDLDRDPVGHSQNGTPVFLADLWPGPVEIDDAMRHAERPDLFVSRYAEVFQGGQLWQALPSATGARFSWSDDSTYLKRPPFSDLAPIAQPGQALLDKARPLLALGDNVTTDHISPVGTIAPQSSAGLYLDGLGIVAKQFNTYGARRGNHDVMARGTFANPRLKNRLATLEGGFTRTTRESADTTVYDAACEHERNGTATIIVAGENYGSGSARDWAAKGTRLLGVKAVVAESFERIHRSNLVGMGVMPLQLVDPATIRVKEISCDHTFRLPVSLEDMQPRMFTDLQMTGPDGLTETIKVIVRIDTARELEYFSCGGILPAVAGNLSRFL